MQNLIYAGENPYISVLEGGEWITEGPYLTALDYDEEVTWTRDGGEFMLHVCYEVEISGIGMSGIGLRKSPATVSEAGSSTTGISGFSDLGLMAGPSTFKEKLVRILQVPTELANHTDKGLADAWMKYKAYLDATKKLDDLWGAGKLVNVFDRKPTQTDLKNLFKGKTQWHDTFQKTFPKLGDYPEMIAWLEDDEDKQQDVDLWGIKKVNYTFADLKEWLENNGEGLQIDDSSSEEVVLRSRDKKMKGKEKAGTKSPSKGKGKEKAKGKGKKRAAGPK
jgi:hypothetical protein